MTIYKDKWSNGPSNYRNTFLIKSCFVFTTFHSQTHYQVLSGSVEINRNHHLVWFESFAFHFSPCHKHSWQTLSDFFLFTDRFDLVRIAPISSFNSKSCNQERFFINLLSIELFYSELQLLQRPSVSLGNKLSWSCHVGFWE